VRTSRTRPGLHRRLSRCPLHGDPGGGVPFDSRKPASESGPKGETPRRVRRHAGSREAIGGPCDAVSTSVASFHMRRTATLASPLAGVLLGTGTAQRKVVTRPLVHESVGEGQDGQLGDDDAKTVGGKPLGRVVVPESRGIAPDVKGNAGELATLGPVAIAIEMYGLRVVMDDPKRTGEPAGRFQGRPLMANLRAHRNSRVGLRGRIPGRERRSP